MKPPHLLFGALTTLVITCSIVSGAGAQVDGTAKPLSAISWFSGTFTCMSKVTFSNGKTEVYKWIVLTSEPENGWLRSGMKGAPGTDYYGYDPKKGKYVMLGIGGPGDYAAAYFAVGKDRSISMQFDNEFSNTSSYAREIRKMTPSTTGYTLVVSGPSHMYPGLRFQNSGACVRQKAP
jgi:hypothetical protein